MSFWDKTLDDMEENPQRLMGAVLFSFIAMLYVNYTIGLMGGMPLAFGLFCSYYRIRWKTAESEYRGIGRLFAEYVFFFLLLWTISRALLFFVQFVGWGCMEGLTIIEYAKNLYGYTLLELWSYVFAFLMMFSFAVSLFPLTVLHKKKGWLVYAICDAAFFLVVCIGIARVCSIWIPHEQQKKITSLIDALYLCETTHKWQAGIFLMLVGLFTALVSVGSCLIGWKMLSWKDSSFVPKKERKQNGIWKQDGNPKRRQKSSRRISRVIGLSVLIGLGAFSVLLRDIIAEEKNRKKYPKAAQYLTKDGLLAPIVYQNEVYIPLDRALFLHETEEPVGYLADKGENVESYFYRLTSGNFLYVDPQQKDELGKAVYLEVYGKEHGSYQAARLVEKSSDWEEDTVFVLWDEEWERQSAFGKERTGYSICEKELVMELEACFQEVDYHIADFEDYDAYFTIRGYENAKKAFTEEFICGDWIGCILVKDNRFYYGNFSNEITGVTLDLLLDILGGNRMPEETEPLTPSLGVSP